MPAHPALTRRTLLRAALAAPLAVAAPRAQADEIPWPPTIPGVPLIHRSPVLTPYVDELPIPPTRGLGGIIPVREGRHSFHRDLPPARSWGYDGLAHLGPTIEVRSGEPAPHTVFANELGEHILAGDIDLDLHGSEHSDLTRPKIVVHLHGAPNEPGSDGHPYNTFTPGESGGYDFNNDLPATTLWYHDHAMGVTRLNMYAGLAGMYWVRDEFDTGAVGNPLGLPAGEFEIPLILQDRLFYPNGEQRFHLSAVLPRNFWGGGFSGDVMCVNGKAWPKLTVGRGLYRFRMVNASAMDDYHLFFGNGMPFWIIGGDGGLLAAPHRVTSLRIGAGERYDLLADFSGLRPGERVELRNDAQINAFSQLSGSRLIPNIMQFVVDERPAFTGPVPRTLRGEPGLPPAIVPIDRAAITRIRTATLNEPVEVKPPFLYFNINNLMFDSEDIELPEEGAVEQWNLVNVTETAHTVHIHLVQFQIVGRQLYDVAGYKLAHPSPPPHTRWTPDAEPFLLGEMSGPGGHEAGWKDTVHCPPFQVTKVLMRFPTQAELGFDPDREFGADRHGRPLRGYVWHCHLGDHEDHDMMLRYRLVKPGAPQPVPHQHGHAH
ncbi:multicopper oxidase domain-containing protein [Nocardia sp. NPDC050712]|uniref:multicopper oxidase family protein n=1 Tax=Nocardia sp. NPDC050712 TaxID=3155518 RepID=UPI0033D6809E